MGFLAPAFLLGALAVSVPLLLHLLHRPDRRRVAFPALRYLLRTEKEHARTIRMRQWLLLVLRCAVVVLATLAAARFVVGSGGSAHPDTAVAILLDNSLSSQRVVGEERVLDVLIDRALETVSAAGPGDRFWVVRVGEPWDVAAPLDAPAAVERIRATRPGSARGDLGDALRRADRILAESDLEHREIHLVSDLQASAFPNDALELRYPVIVWAGTPAPGTNRYVRSAVVGGGLAPRADRRTEVAITVGASTDDTVAAPVRLFLQGQLRGAADARSQSTVLLPAGPFPEGDLEGYAETDPDDLRADDRRWFVTRVAPPPRVAVAGSAGGFVREALAVLEESGRIRMVPLAEADVLISVAGEGLDARAAGVRAVVVPHPDPALRTATNQRLANAGAGLSLGEAASGLRTGEDRTRVQLDSIRLDVAWSVDGTGETLVRRSDGVPWLVETTTTRGPVSVVGSPFTLDATSLPVEAGMLPFLEELVTGPGGAGTLEWEAGASIPLSRFATEVETPAGLRLAVGPDHRFPFTTDVGIHRVWAGDSVIARIAVNPPLAESRLEPIDGDRLAVVLPGEIVVADDAASWRRDIFLSRRGRELGGALLVAVLLLLLAESWVAASGGVERRTSPGSSTEPLRAHLSE